MKRTRSPAAEGFRSAPASQGLEGLLPAAERGKRERGREGKRRRGRGSRREEEGGRRGGKGRGRVRDEPEACMLHCKVYH